MAEPTSRCATKYSHQLKGSGNVHSVPIRLTRQIHQPPAHHAVDGGIGSGIDDLGQRLALGGVEDRGVARRFAVQQPIRAVRVEGQDRLDEIATKQVAGTPIEVWWQDEARIGQKNKITRRWARRGTRPSAPHDQRTKLAYLFGAICPALGKGAGLVLPFCNTAAMPCT
jgi:hypothetical protein